MIGKTLFSVCFLSLFISLTIILCWLISRRSARVEYVIKGYEVNRNVNVKKKAKVVSPRVPKSLEGECQFGINFITTSLDTTRHVKRYRLPAHYNKNFTGTLLGLDLLCLDTMDAGEGQNIGIFECHGQGRNQGVTFMTDGRLISNAKLPLCIAVKNMVSVNVILKKCNKHDDTQVWTKDPTNGLIMPKVRKDYCLNAPPDEGLHVTVRPCKLHLPTQRWRLIMNEVMLLWVEGAPTDSKTNKIKKSIRKQVNKLILQNRPTENMDNVFNLPF